MCAYISAASAGLVRSKQSNGLRGAYLKVMYSSEHSVALGLSWTHSVDNVPNHLQRLERHLSNNRPRELASLPQRWS